MDQEAVQKVGGLRGERKALVSWGSGLILQDHNHEKFCRTKPRLLENALFTKESGMCASVRNRNHAFRARNPMAIRKIFHTR